MSKQIAELEVDLSDTKGFKTGLKNEVGGEMQMITDIGFIINKYKKLIAEQSREKERFAT